MFSERGTMATESNLIRSVSYLAPDGHGGEKRMHAHCRGGRFPHKLSWYVPSIAASARYSFNRNNAVNHLTAKELIEAVKSADPVLELMDGSKLRVFLGGSDQMLVMAACLIDSHDEFFSPPPDSMW